MWFIVVCTLIDTDTGHHTGHNLCCETIFSSDTSTKRETAIFKIFPPAVIILLEVIMAEYDAILSQ